MLKNELCKGIAFDAKVYLLEIININDLELGSRKKEVYGNETTMPSVYFLDVFGDERSYNDANTSSPVLWIEAPIGSLVMRGVCKRLEITKKDRSRRF